MEWVSHPELSERVCSFERTPCIRAARASSWLWYGVFLQRSPLSVAITETMHAAVGKEMINTMEVDNKQQTWLAIKSLVSL